MNKKVSHCGALVVILMLYACAAPTIVQSVKPEEAAMNCEKFQSEYQLAIRNCSAVTKEKTASVSDSRSAAPGQTDKPMENGPGASKEARLEELKRLFYMKHLSKEAYSEMKKGILESP